MNEYFISDHIRKLNELEIKEFKIKTNKKIIDDLLELKDKTNKEIFEILKKNTYKEFDIKSSSEYGIESLLRFINLPKRDYYYLDIGAGTGYKTKLLRTSLDIKLENTFCLDLQSDNFETNIEKEACNFVYYDGNKMPFKDNSFNLITIFLVIHHVKNLDIFFREIYRILQKKGFLIIREHDINNKHDDNNMKLLHLIYNIMKKKKIENYIEEVYLSKKELLRKLNNFRLIKYSKENHFTKSRYYLFIKN